MFSFQTHQTGRLFGLRVGANLRAWPLRFGSVQEESVASDSSPGHALVRCIFLKKGSSVCTVTA
jgi:hypothetical protein